MEDIFQTVFLKFVLHDGVFESPEHEKAWLIRVTINACRDLLKSFYRKNVVLTDRYTEQMVPAASYENREILEMVLALPDKYKDVIYLFYYEGYTAAEIGLKNRIENAFSEIKADEELKDRTFDFLQEKINDKNKRAGNHGMKFRRLAISLAAVLLIVAGGFGYNAYASETAYISIDMNPSIELGINRFGRVISTKAYDNDSAGVLNGLELKDKKYEEAVSELLDSEKFGMYIKDDSVLVFTVSGSGEKNILKGLKSCSRSVNVQKEYGTCTGAERRQAHKAGMSFGKYKASEKLENCDPSVTTEDCRNMTMKKIKELIDENTDSGGDKKCDDSENRQNRRGQ